MNRIGALGETAKVEGFALAGALVFAADQSAEVDAAWTQLPDDLAVLILTPVAAAHLDTRLGDRPHLLSVVMPE
jgi:vacuolar-type H+-ATPase subunit F/Vma7